uniref:Uncharacterized protein n=1 Tax=Oryza glumipatula TaxID=40148 RepID=A0A0E0BU18_9ORYZ
MEATAVSLGKSVLDGALHYAKSSLAEEVALQLGVQRDQAFIRDELEMMNSFLMAAHDARDGNKVVRTWVKQVRDVAYDVEDCLQDFAVRLGKKKPSWWLSPSALKERRRIAKQMKALRGKVEDVSQRNMRYQLIKGSEPTATDFVPNNTARVTMSGTNEAWRQEEKAKADLIHLVINKVEDLRVIAVWGTSGDRRETSITERAYNNLKRKNKFECYAWIDLTHPLKRTELLQNIVRQLYVRSLQEDGKATPACQALMRMLMVNEDHLADEFNRYLSDKCYLIVVTDLSNAEGWEQIKMCFPDNKKGSRIIVSTQEVEVAILCAGTEEAAPKHTQLFADRTLYAFHYEGEEEVTYSIMESSSSLNTAIRCSSSSAEGKSLTRTETMVAAFRESDFIGRVHEKEEIIELILKDSGQHKIISVWGMGGMGKTALIRDVYQSEKVQGMFDKLACVTIKRPFNPNDLITSLLDQLKDQKADEGKGTPKISDRKEPSLVDILYGKKYLIVLDDVLSTKEWDAIVSNFPDMGIGSRIIVTTRHESIAMHCSGNRDEKCYRLHNLEEKDAEELFTNKVFKQPKNLDGLDPELVEEAKLILKKCSGLPLAIVTIGGFLTSRPKTALEWRKLNEHISAELETNPELGGIRTVLNISYDGLPYHLKSCFLYLSIFPEDHEINRKRLARRWTAEGYSRGIWDKSPKEISDNYFFELLDRSMILPTQKSYSGKGTQFCQLHDIIRDIAISKSKEENLVLRLDGGRISHDHGTVRHLAITNGSWEMDENELETAIDMSRLRSLTVFGVWRPFFISDKMRLLRVLDLEDTEGVRGHQIKKIGKLVHLRYLSLRGCREIAFLPDSFGKLSQLETLDVRGTSIIKLPKAIINLRKLNYLHAGDTDARNFEDVFDDLPKPIRSRLCLGLMMLCFLCIFCWCPGKVFDEMSTHELCTICCCSVLPATAMRLHGVLAPRGLRRLTALHTLGVVNIAWDPSVLEDIKMLTQLRKLGVTGVNKKNSQKLLSALAALSRLESLSVWSQGNEDLSSCLNGDYEFSPPKDLKSLKLYGKLVELPKWIQQLKNLVKLKLTDTRLKNHDAAIQALGELPNLAILNMWQNSYEGEELHFLEGSFGSLVVLMLDFNNIKNVKFGRGAFSKLELIVLCALNFGDVETTFSELEFLPSIKEVQLNGYSQNKEATEKLKEHLLAKLSENPKKPILNNYFHVSS